MDSCLNITTPEKIAEIRAEFSKQKWPHLYYFVHGEARRHIQHLIVYIDALEAKLEGFEDRRMTTTTQPLPDEVEKALNAIDPWLNTVSGGILRAHIAAQDEKIAELEEQIECMTKHQAGTDEKLAEFEAENKRLREAIQYAITEWKDRDNMGVFDCLKEAMK